MTDPLPACAESVMLAVQQRGTWCSLDDLVLRTTYTRRRLRDVLRALVEAGLLKERGGSQYAVTRKGAKWRPALRENEIRRLRWTRVCLHASGGYVYAAHLARYTWTANVTDETWCVEGPDGKSRSGTALDLRAAKVWCKKWLRFYMNEGKR